MSECSHEGARQWNYVRWCPVCGAFQQAEGMGWVVPYIAEDRGFTTPDDETVAQCMARLARELEETQQELNEARARAGGYIAEVRELRVRLEDQKGRVEYLRGERDRRDRALEYLEDALLELVEEEDSRMAAFAFAQAAEMVKEKRNELARFEAHLLAEPRLPSYPKEGTEAEKTAWWVRMAEDDLAMGECVHANTRAVSQPDGGERGWPSWWYWCKDCGALLEGNMRPGHEDDPPKVHLPHGKNDGKRG